jgi:hypothetical protein
MILDTGLFSLNLELVDYIEKIDDREQGYGIKIVFLQETKKAPKIHFFGLIKEYRPGEWEDDNKCRIPNRCVSIIFINGNVELMHSYAIPNFQNSGISLNIPLQNNYPNDPSHRSELSDVIHGGINANYLTYFVKNHLNTLKSDETNRNDFYKFIIDKMNFDK